MLRYLLIAEDHPICFAALEIAAHSRDSAIFVEASETLAGTVERLGCREYSALLLDLGLKDSQGIINLKTIRDHHPRIPILIISAQDDLSVQFRARAFGAQGFLSKKASLDRMGEAIEVVMAGGRHFDLPADAPAEDPDLLDSLSAAQVKILQQLLSGHSNKVIAYNLDISESTVKSHLHAIFRILGVSNRSQAIMKFQPLADS